MCCKRAYMCLLFLFLVVLVAVPVESFGAKPDLSKINEWMFEVGKLRNMSEVNVRLGEEYFKGNPEKLLKLQELYGPVQANGNAFIDFVKLTLAGKKMPPQEEWENSLRDKAREVAEPAKKLEDFVRGTRGFDWIVQVIKGLVDGGLAVWKEWRAADAETIKAVSDVLDTFKWKTWDKLPHFPS